MKENFFIIFGRFVIRLCFQKVKNFFYNRNFNRSCGCFVVPCLNGNFSFTLAYGGNKSVLANRCNVGIAACICNVQISHFIGQGRLDLAGKIGGNSCLGYIKLNGVVGCIGYAHVSRNL